MEGTLDLGGVTSGTATVSSRSAVGLMFGWMLIGQKMDMA